VDSNIRNPIANDPPLVQNLRSFHPSYACSLFHGSSQKRVGTLMLAFQLAIYIRGFSEA
jgi:hypothetical protein